MTPLKKKINKELVTAKEDNENLNVGSVTMIILMMMPK